MSVIGCFEGGNPQGKDAISRISDNVFLVKPFCEDNQANYKFRLDIVIKNEGAQRRVVNVIVDWDDSTHSRYRDNFYMKEPGGEWRPVRATIYEALTRLSLQVLPGKTHLSLNPSYSYSQYVELVKRFSSKQVFSKTLLYTTDLGREVYVLNTETTDRQSKKLLITARTHPYESAGSYCIEGLLDGVAKMGFNGILKGYELWIVPMVCPDGVADGLCRLNKVGAPDLSREIDIHNDLCRAFLNLIDEIKPSLFLEFHNWMLKDHDGIFYLSAWDTVITILRMRMQTASHVRKPWARGLDNFVVKRKPLGLKQYAVKQLGAKCATVEFPWFNRSPYDMKTLGLRILLSILPII